MVIADQSSAAAKTVVRHIWRPGGLAFLLVSLFALAVGAFPEFLLPPHLAEALPTLPALQVLLAAQAGFLVMFYPLLAARRPCGGTGVFLASAAVECLTYLAVSIPLYIVAAYLSDATATDVIRGALYLTAVASLAWGLGLWAQTGRAAIITAATLAGALIAVGIPVVYYLLVELTGAGASIGWLFSAGPITCAFSVAVARTASWYPAPIWAWALWPVAGAVLTFAFQLVGPNRSI